MFAGKDLVAPPIDDQKLDLAVLRLAPSQLAGDLGKRKLSLGQVSAGDFSSAEIVAAAGYPAAPNLYVPGSIHSKYGDILKRLLEGDGGAKRFAPGVPSTFIGNSGPSNWTVEPANTSP